MRTPLHLALRPRRSAPGSPPRRRFRRLFPNREIFSPGQIGHALAAADAAGGTHRTERRECPAGRRAVDHARQELRTDTLFRAHARSHRRTSGRLPLQFTFSLGVIKGEEAAPIVADNTMYIVTAYPNYVYALDLTKPGAPMKWRFAPNPAPASQGIACCDVVNRGGSVDHGKYIFNTLDGQTIALDVKTGKPVWRTQLGNITIGETITMAPLVADGKVYVGNSGGEMGVRGWFVGAR